MIHRSRTFFGVLRVCDEANGPSRKLVHGGIIHGVQLVSQDSGRRRIPLSYYAEAGPPGSVFQGLRSLGRVHRDDRGDLRPADERSLAMGTLRRGRAGRPWTDDHAAVAEALRR